jgi:alpha-1,6-mannosyltransferase
MRKKKLFLSGLLMELLYLLYRWIPTNPAHTVIKYMAVYAGGFILMTIGFRLIKNQEFSRFFFSTVMFFSLLFGITLVTALPHQSDDIYRYLWDGKLQYYGISPYTYAPADPALGKYHSELLPATVNFPKIKTIYPPVAQLFFRLSYTLFGESVTGMKFLFLFFILGSSALFYSILQREGGEARWFLFFAWNPLLIMETAVNGHLDILMVFFLLLSLWFFFRQQLILAGIGLACAILTKLVPVILLPIFFFYFLFPVPSVFSVSSVCSVAKKIFKFFFPLLLTIAGFYALYFASARNMFLTALNYSSKWYFNNPLFHLLFRVLKNNATAHLVSFCLFTGLFLWILVRPLELQKKIVFALGAFVICNPTIHPWYLLILLALLCLYRSPMIVLWSGLVVSGYIVVYQFKATGTWRESWVSLSIEYIPLAILALFFCLRRVRTLLKKGPDTPQNF